MKRRSRKLSKFSLNLPQALIENLDYLADEVGSDRTDVITEILEAIMESEDFIDIIFGEVLEETEQTEKADSSATETENDDESDEEDSEEGESEKNGY